MRDDYGPDVGPEYVDRFQRDLALGPILPPNVIELLPYRVAPKGVSRETIKAAVGILTKAAYSISDKTWLQGINAYGPGGFECDPLDKAAIGWSLDGAMVRAAGRWGNPINSPADVAWQALSRSIWSRHGGITTSHFNDVYATNAADVVREIAIAIDLLVRRAKFKAAA